MLIKSVSIHIHTTTELLTNFQAKILGDLGLRLLITYGTIHNYHPNYKCKYLTYLNTIGQPFYKQNNHTRIELKSVYLFIFIQLFKKSSRRGLILIYR